MKQKPTNKPSTNGGPIDLKAALSKKMTAKQGGDSFKFETILDQLIFEFICRRTQKTDRGEDAELVEVRVLAGEKTNLETKRVEPVKPGERVNELPEVRAVGKIGQCHINGRVDPCRCRSHDQGGG